MAALAVPFHDAQVHLLPALTRRASTPQRLHRRLPPQVSSWSLIERTSEASASSGRGCREPRLRVQADPADGHGGAPTGGGAVLGSLACCAAALWGRQGGRRGCGRFAGLPAVGGGLVAGRGSRRREARSAACAGKKNSQVTLSDVASGKNFYDILGVDRDASQDDIRAAYKNRIRETHPDLNQSPEAADEFMEVQEAFRWLSDPGQRDVYDSVGGKFGQDAIYDYTDESILGRLDEIQKLERCLQATAVVNECHLDMISKSRNNQVRIDLSIADIRKRFRKFGNDRIAFVRRRLCGELRQILEYASLIDRLHPFERLSVELTLTQHVEQGGAPFGQLLGAVKQLRQTICEEAASSGKACRTARRGRESTFIADAAIERMYELFTSYAPVFHQISSAQIALLRSPCIDLDKPTVVFVGAPNVGKSSLVRSISTGKAEVNSYCFTTKQLTIGHLWHFIAGTPLLIHGQIVDSPGMRGLWEPNNKKYNLFDQLTLGSMEHLPTGVVFTFDPYPITHGILSITEQVELRNQLRAKFPKRPWLDVITKVDRVEPEAIEGIATLSRLFPDALRVSALEGTGLAELNMAVRGLLEEMTRVVRQLQRAKIRQLRAGRSDEGFVSKEALILR